MKATDYLAEARSHLGMRGRPNQATLWYASKHGNVYQTAEWCDMFISWCASNLKGSATVGEFAYTPSHVAWFKKNNAWGSKPKVGAIVFYNWRTGARPWGTAQHVGVVEAVKANGNIVAIEGNTGDAVQRKLRDGHYVIGYGYPSYVGGGSKPSTPYPGKLIRPGDSGDSVRVLKNRLRELGYKKVQSGPNYKAFAVNAVKDFQKKRSLDVDGIVGPDTWRELFQ